MKYSVMQHEMQHEIESASTVMYWLLLTFLVVGWITIPRRCAPGSAALAGSWFFHVIDRRQYVQIIINIAKVKQIMHSYYKFFISLCN